MSYLDSIIQHTLINGRALTLQMGNTLHIVNRSGESTFVYRRLELTAQNNQHYLKDYDDIEDILNLMENLSPLPLWLAKWS